MKSGKARRPTPGGNRVLRIIGGQWRGRKLQFPDIEGVRPTPDRVRETLFNWLQPVITGARCLDLFAGSGALGWEGLSRGAATMTMVEKAPAVARYLQQTGQLLQAEGARIQCADAVQYLQGEAEPYDIIFLDPPFRQGLLATCLESLISGRWLSEHALIYTEVEKELSPFPLPDGWQVRRHKQAGQVAYYLLERVA
ncbi:MAG: 16S rRNA (guanine(966)-N(2))-methyltransferase RsmD [Gammaproteobacteria bacterium]|nr:16S rRNA (guanine(966)-N(2))-methyltransferase RsmD [Gammaproteobacteria bacterium]